MAEMTYSYFPGCSLATTAKENNDSLINFAKDLGITLKELGDWNCCGSSSAHSIDHTLADQLAMRNLSLAPADRPLLVACPSCNLRLQQANIKLQEDEAARRKYQEWFGQPAPRDLHIMHFFELLDQLDWMAIRRQHAGRLNGLTFTPYYGCMLARPPAMRHMKNYYGIMEKILSGLGATPVSWGYSSRCCGTFLSVVRPDVVTDMVRKILANAKHARADCIVTACAMCHMNLEVRSAAKAALPIFHFSEILALAFQHADTDAYFERHLIDPRPMLKQYHLIL
ncbi:MAG: heterodisulfide reductase-related iron-sulfur binding cluster [Desulfobacteraceae bacterium]